MKNKKALCEFLAAASLVYDREVSKPLTEIYWQALGPYSDEQCLDAFNQAIVKCKFFPKPADLVEFITGSDSDKAMIAWQTFDRTARLMGPYTSVRFNDPVIHSVVQLLGGWVEVCTSTNKDWPWVQKRFLELYRVASKKGDHPEYLPGIHETNNSGRYDDFVEAPKNIGGFPQEKAITVDIKKLTEGRLQ